VGSEIPGLRFHTAEASRSQRVLVRLFSAFRLKAARRPGSSTTFIGVPASLFR
jgi:hypothetical protein